MATPSSLSVHGQRAVENSQAQRFCFGDVRAVLFAAGRKEKSAGAIRDTFLLPLPGKDEDGLVGLRMNMSRNGQPRLKFSQDGHAARFFVFMKDKKLSLIHISEPTRQAEISYAVFC